MQTVTTIGLDIAKSLFQVHGVDANGGVVIRRQLKRRYVLAFFQKLPSCLIGIEACASSHFWARELRALGHIPRLMPPAYVKPYVKRQKNDAADAEAICEAVTRATMRFVEIKTPEHSIALAISSSVNRLRSSIRSVPTLRSSASLRRSAAGALRNCSRSWKMLVTIGFQKLHARVSWRWACNCGCSRSKSWSSTA